MVLNKDRKIYVYLRKIFSVNDKTHKIAPLKVWEYEFYRVQKLPRSKVLGRLTKLDLSESITSVPTGFVPWFTIFYLLQTSVCFKLHCIS